jgi:hypothetical protein
MKHQINFLGGQLLPTYIGIKEFMPDKIHFFASNESKEGIRTLKNIFPEIIFSEFICDPFDFYSIKKRIQSIIEKLDAQDDVLINLTGGTKIMLLAAQSIISEFNLKGFYVNQDYSFIEVPSYDKKQITSELSIKDFFGLSGHKIFSAKMLSDFTENDLRVSKLIASFAASNKIYSEVTAFLRKKYRVLPEKGTETTTGNAVINWDVNIVEIHSNNKSIACFNGNNVRDLFFNATWWELIVASEVGNWAKAKEIILHCELPFKTDNKTLKNEIDILINTGNKLIFVECKSGNIKQEDINKMKVIKQTYGGLISKSLLVSRYIPSQSIMEKCKELDIEVFYVYAFHRVVNPLKDIYKTLDKLEKKSSI